MRSFNPDRQSISFLLICNSFVLELISRLKTIWKRLRGKLSSSRVEQVLLELDPDVLKNKTVSSANSTISTSSSTTTKTTSADDIEQVNQFFTAKPGHFKHKGYNQRQWEAWNKGQKDWDNASPAKGGDKGVGKGDKGKSKGDKGKGKSYDSDDKSWKSAYVSLEKKVDSLHGGSPNTTNADAEKSTNANAMNVTANPFQREEKFEQAETVELETFLAQHHQAGNPKPFQRVETTPAVDFTANHSAADKLFR